MIGEGGKNTYLIPFRRSAPRWQRWRGLTAPLAGQPGYRHILLKGTSTKPEEILKVAPQS